MNSANAANLVFKLATYAKSADLHHVINFTLL
jgi:hypothetical protein